MGGASTGDVAVGGLAAGGDDEIFGSEFLIVDGDGVVV